MATSRKKKSDVIIDATGQDVVQIVKGSHLTVTTFPNGKTELVWDDEALLREVKAAIASVETKPAKKSKAKAK
jgi:S-adenosylmethionine/arginine decarboxylase-like enzyme